MKTAIMKLLGYILTPVYLIVFGLLLIVFHPIQVICRTIGGYSAHKRSVDIMNFLIIKSLFIVGAKISFRGFRNHHPKFISKIELGKGIPSVSYNLRYGGSALIDRKKPLQSVREIGKLGRYIEKNKYTASIFPEGTRTKDGKMKPFLSAGVDTLLTAAPSAVVVPLAIDGNYELLKKGLYPMAFGVKVTCTVLDPIEPGTMAAEELVMKTENSIRAALEQSVKK
jgi:1-acyl-sn-glycerol-3-phosphate acyltransferase